MFYIDKLLDLIWRTKNSRVKRIPNNPNIKINPNQEMHLLLNDPSTPDLFIITTNLPTPKIYPPFKTQGYIGPVAKPGTMTWRSAQVHYTIMNSLNFLQSNIETPINRWGRASELTIIPEAGKDLNAYYDGRSLRFFFDKHPKTNQLIYSADASDIVTHELGHALLDAIRPDLWNMQALEVWAFHESWSDIIAVLSIMSHDEVLEYALKETNGDLTKPNVITRLAEQFGKIIYDLSPIEDGRLPDALRDANNSFIYQTPETLPEDAPNNQIASECHSFGRIFLGAYWQFIIQVFNKECNKGLSKIDALKKSSVVAIKLLHKASMLAAATPRFYDSVARMMLLIDSQMGGNYQQELTNAFTSRRILNNRSVKAQSVSNIQDLDLKKSQVHCFDNGFRFVRTGDAKKIKLSDHFGVKAQSNNPLYNCEIDIPNEQHLLFNAAGQLIDSIATSQKTAITSARSCIKYLHKNNLVSETYLPEGDLSKPFSIVDGKLVRNFFT